MSMKIKKANSIVGPIRRCFSFLDCKLFKKFHITFVRPHLEYAQVVWAPHLMKICEYDIENVQKRAMKLVDGLDYATRLKKKTSQHCHTEELGIHHSFFSFMPYHQRFNFWFVRNFIRPKCATEVFSPKLNSPKTV